MTFRVEVFRPFRSPCSYLATLRLAALQGEYDVAFTVRPVYPIALRIPGFFRGVDPMWPPSLLLGRAADGVPRRTVLRSGPHRRAAVAHAAGGPVATAASNVT